MLVAQGQEQPLRSRTLAHLTPGPTTSTTATTKATSTSTRTATALLPSVALILALSCLFSPVVLMQAVSASVVVNAAALPLSSAACGYPLLTERTRTLTTVHGFDCTPHSQFLDSLVEPKAKTDPDAAALDQQEKGVSPGSTFVIDKTVVPVIEILKERWMSESEDLIYSKPPESRDVSNSSVDGETTRGVQSLSPLYSLPPLNWIRTHLGTKTPYPHESRPVGPLKDTPEGYELVQLHLVRNTWDAFFTQIDRRTSCVPLAFALAP